MLTCVGTLLTYLCSKCVSAPPLKIFLLLCIFSGSHANLIIISPMQTQLISSFVDSRMNFTAACRHIYIGGDCLAVNSQLDFLPSDLFELFRFWWTNDCTWMSFSDKSEDTNKGAPEMLPCCRTPQSLPVEVHSNT